MRLERGLTQTQLGELIGVSQRVISNYETVADCPPAHAIVKLSKVLNVSTDEILGLKTRKQKPDVGVIKDPATRRLWKNFQQMKSLPEKDRRAVIRLINSLVSAQDGNERQTKSRKRR